MNTVQSFYSRTLEDLTEQIDHFLEPILRYRVVALSHAYNHDFVRYTAILVLEPVGD